jgi:hypothetical protein
VTAPAARSTSTTAGLSSSAAASSAVRVAGGRTATGAANERANRSVTGSGPVVSS